MARVTTPVLLLPVLLLLAFFVGRMTAPESSSTRSPGSTGERDERARLEEDLATLRKEHSALEAEIIETRSAWDGERARWQSTSRPAQRTAETRPHNVEEVDSDPEATLARAEERAAELLATLEVALEDGDSKRIAELTPELLELGAWVASDLVELLQHADSLFEMESLSRLLGTLQVDEALATLQGLLQQQDNDGVRVAVVDALGKIPDPSSVALLTAEFSRKSDSPMAPSLAASSLGNIGTPEAVTALQTEITGGANGMVRAFALRALSALQDPELVPFFLEQAQRSEGVNERYRKSAIEAIGETGDDGAIRSLESLLRSSGLSEGLEEATKRAINKLAGEILYPL